MRHRAGGVDEGFYAERFDASVHANACFLRDSMRD
jgi:hypothetical protein